MCHSYYESIISWLASLVEVLQEATLAFQFLLLQVRIPLTLREAAIRSQKLEQLLTLTIMPLRLYEEFVSLVHLRCVRHNVIHSCRQHQDPSNETSIGWGWLHFVWLVSHWCGSVGCECATQMASFGTPYERIWGSSCWPPPYSEMVSFRSASTPSLDSLSSLRCY